MSGTATELATAYLSLVPSFKGGKAAIAKELSGAESAAAASGASTGKKFAGGMKSGLVGLGVLAAAGTGALKVGGDFQAAYKLIRSGTGETGKDLDGLKTDFKELLAVRPNSMEEVATAITSVRKASGLTGKPLQDLSKQYLQLSGATGTDLQSNVKTTGQLFTNYSIATGKQADKLDLLYRASQRGELSVQEIAAAMTKAGPVARQLGLDFDDTAGLVTMLSKAGIDIGEVMPAMSKTIKSAAAEGKDAGEVFRGSFKAIAGAKTDSEAAGVAVEAFGAKAGPKLAGLIREGKLSYEDFVKGLQNGKETIAATATDTGTMSGKLKTLKNSFLVAIEPLASGAFDAANKALKDWLPLLIKIIQRGASMPGWIKKTVIALALLVPAVKVFKKVHSGVNSVVSGLKGMYRASVAAKDGIIKTASAVKSGASTLASYAKSGLSAAASVAKTTAAWVAQKAALIASKVATLAMAAAQKAATVAQWAFNTAMSANPIMLIVLGIGALIAGLVLAYKKVGWFRAAVDAAFGGIKTVVGGVVGFIRKHWQLLLAIITGPVGMAVLLVTKHWDKIKGGAQAVVGWVRDHWRGLLAIITGPIGAAVLVVTSHWDKIKAGFRIVRDYIRGRVSDIAGFVTGLPGRLKSIANRLRDVLLSPWKAAFRAIAKLWNNTVGKLSFKVPSWVPKLGGKGWDVPNISTAALDKYHSGGKIPGRTGDEVPILGLAGERVLSIDQNRRYERWLTRGDRGDHAGGGVFGPLIGHAEFHGQTHAQMLRALRMWLLSQAQEVMAG